MDTEKHKGCSRAATITEEEAPLSPQRAFVVQFRAGRKGGPLAGRVEHMVSGQATHFQSWEDLLAFMERGLNEVRA